MTGICALKIAHRHIYAQQEHGLSYTMNYNIKKVSLQYSRALVPLHCSAIINVTTVTAESANYMRHRAKWALQEV